MKFVETAKYSVSIHDVEVVELQLSFCVTQFGPGGSSQLISTEKNKKSHTIHVICYTNAKIC